MAELGFVNDEIAAAKAADGIDLADYSDSAVEREYEARHGGYRGTQHQLKRIWCHLRFTRQKSSITPAPHSIK